MLYQFHWLPVQALTNYIIILQYRLPKKKKKKNEENEQAEYVCHAHQELGCFVSVCHLVQEECLAAARWPASSAVGPVAGLWAAAVWQPCIWCGHQRWSELREWDEIGNVLKMTACVLQHAASDCHPCLQTLPHPVEQEIDITEQFSTNAKQRYNI